MVRSRGGGCRKVGFYRDILINFFCFFRGFMFYCIVILKVIYFDFFRRWGGGGGTVFKVFLCID